MCDEITERENEIWLAKKGLTRRSAAVMGVSAGAIAMAGCASSDEADEIASDAAATADEMAEAAMDMALVKTNVEITTPDGVCDAYFVHPAKGAHAAVLVWPDVFGLRPAFEQMGERLAASGYAVLTVNPFYRSAKAPTTMEGETFADPAFRQRIGAYRAKMTPEATAKDAKALIGWLDEQDAVDSSKGVGTTGYCMGGPLVFRTCGYAPERVRAGASFHGGGLVTEGENSPHKLIPNMKSGMLVAVAENDDEKEPEVKGVLKQTFADNGLSAEIEVYEDAMHGWCPPDSRVYNEAQAEKAWSRLLALFETNLA